MPGLGMETQGEKIGVEGGQVLDWPLGIIQS